ncbi:MAG: ATP-binding cassette domain-containing protein [Spirochaetales bacterium]|nr:ATP-binding cassette domain-containing protein [Spirochaetales bacterium]
MDYVLETKSLLKSYRHVEALSGVDMHVPKDSIYGLVGRNGAGKTTLMRVVAGMQKENGGTYLLFGVDKNSREIKKERKRVGAMIESPAIFHDLSAEDNLKMQYWILGLPSFDTIPEILSTVGLENTGNKKAGSFSFGMKQRLGIAMAIAGNPDLLILDEPINGLDPEAIVEMRELILRLNREMNMTIIVSSHILDELAKVATYYGFIDSGRMVKEVSAVDMEKECRKALRIKVESIEKAAIALTSLGNDYSVIDDNTLDIFGDIGIKEVLDVLSGAGIKDIEKRNENLEGYFINTMGGCV